MKLWSPLAALVLPLLTYGATQTWTIANSQIRRTLAFDEASGLFTQQLSDLTTHADFIAPGKLRSSRLRNSRLNATDARIAEQVLTFH